MRREKTGLEEIRQGLPDLFPRLWRYCLALTSNRERANDLAQAACLHALEKARHFEPGTHLDRWLFRLTQRLWLNELRADTVRRGQGLLPVEDIDLPDKKSDPHANLYAKEVLSAVVGLPEAQRVTVVLVYVEGYSYREASEVLEIPIGTVMSRLAAGRKTLAARLERREMKLG
ncbi:MAG: RNA polymerase sigma factor [Gammaproteobacteria bacterium]|nr:RNA polymerase sigma factor [Gammaproteobacteria bacterium]